MLTKKYLIPAGYSRRLITTEKNVKIESRIANITSLAMNTKPTEITVLLCLNLIDWLNQVLIQE